MSSVSSIAKNQLSVVIRFLNQPSVKEGVKKFAGITTCAFGIVEVYDIYKIMQGRKITTETFSGSPKWVVVINKVIIVCAKVSLILSAGVSRPGVYLISNIVGSLISTAKLDSAFGPNTIFAINPWHPRHVISIISVLLAAPALAQTTYKTASWTYKKICCNNTSTTKASKFWLTDTKVRIMTLFNTGTSRPVLHIGNQLGRFILRS